MNAGSTLGTWLRSLPSRTVQRVDSVGRLNLIGLDMAPARKERRHGMLVPTTIAAVVVGALVLVGLRNDIRRMRYAAADAIRSERELLEEKRVVTVELRRLREPTLLAERALELGFAKPDRVIRLPAEKLRVPPPVAAGPRP